MSECGAAEARVSGLTILHPARVQHLWALPWELAFAERPSQPRLPPAARVGWPFPGPLAAGILGRHQFAPSDACGARPWLLPERPRRQRGARRARARPPAPGCAGPASSPPGRGSVGRWSEAAASLLAACSAFSQDSRQRPGPEPAPPAPRPLCKEQSPWVTTLPASRL